MDPDTYEYKTPEFCKKIVRISLMTCKLKKIAGGRHFVLNSKYSELRYFNSTFTRMRQILTRVTHVDISNDLHVTNSSVRNGCNT